MQSVCIKTSVRYFNVGNIEPALQSVFCIQFEGELRETCLFSFLLLPPQMAYAPQRLSCLFFQWIPLQEVNQCHIFLCSPHVPTKPAGCSTESPVRDQELCYNELKTSLQLVTMSGPQPWPCPFPPYFLLLKRSADALVQSVSSFRVQCHGQGRFGGCWWNHLLWLGIPFVTFGLQVCIFAH